MLSFQLSVQVCSLLGQNEGERKACFEGCKKEGYIVKLPPRALGCHKRWKVSPFVKFEIVLPLLWLSLDPFRNKTRLLLWSTNNADRNGVNKQNTHTHTHTHTHTLTHTHTHTHLHTHTHTHTYTHTHTKHSEEDCKGLVWK